MKEVHSFNSIPDSFQPVFQTIQPCIIYRPWNSPLILVLVPRGKSSPTLQSPSRNHKAWIRVYILANHIYQPHAWLCTFTTLHATLGCFMQQDWKIKSAWNGTSIFTRYLSQSPHLANNHWWSSLGVINSPNWLDVVHGAEPPFNY